MRFSAFVLSRLLLFVVAFLPSSHAWSQRDADSGQWQILEARYGSTQQDIDVTERLRELVRNDTAFRVTNELFGRDPHPNVVKRLRIRARGPLGVTRTFEFAENQTVYGTQFTGASAGNTGQAGGSGQGGYLPGDTAQWQVLEARYGSAQHSIDVTQRIRDLARNDAAFKVSNDLFGRDPHPNVVKTLRMTVRAPGGATRSFEYAENQVVQRSQFTGWGSGNWGQAGGGGTGRDSGADSGW